MSSLVKTPPKLNGIIGLGPVCGRQEFAYQVNVYIFKKRFKPFAPPLKDSLLNV